MKKYNVIILAGGEKGPLYDSHKYANKALLPIHGKPMLDWVVEAFNESEYIDNIIVVGSEELDQLSSMRYVKKRLSVGFNAIQNLVHGITYLKTSIHTLNQEHNGYLISFCDAVFLNKESINKTIENIIKSQTDIALHYVEKQSFEQAGIKAKRTYIPIGDKEYTGTSIYYIRRFSPILNFLTDLISLRANRKNKQGLIKTIGAQNANNLEEVAQILAEKVTANVKIFESPYVELGMDVDKPSDVELAEQHLASPWKHNYKKAKLIYNPQAGQGQQIAPLFKKLLGIKYRKFEIYEDRDQYFVKIKEYLKEYGLDIEIQATKEKGEATKIAKKCVEQGYDLVIAAGGDGTINEIINGLAYSDTTLAVIPLGTANIFSMEINLPVEIKALCQTIAQGNTKKIDLGKVNDRYFSCMAGIGFDAHVLQKSDSKWKKIYGALAYIFIGIWNLCTYKFKNIIITIDDQPLPRKGCFIVIGNGKYYGGGEVSFTTKACLDDGYLDACIFRYSNIPAIFNYLLGFNRGNIEKHLIVDYFKCKKIVIEKKGNHGIHVDAEYLCDTPAEITVCPASLNVVI